MDTGRSARLAHLSAITAARASGLPPELTLLSEGGDVWTFIREQNHPGLLADLIDQLPTGRSLLSAKVHSAKDEALVLDVFRFGEAPRFDPSDLRLVEKRALVLEYAEKRGDGDRLEALAQHFESCSVEYLSSATPLRIWEHWRMSTTVAATDDTVVSIEPEVAAPGTMRITWRRATCRPGRCLGGSCVTWACAGWISFALISTCLMMARGERSPSSVWLCFRRVWRSTAWTSFARSWAGLKWIDDDALDQAYQDPDTSLLQAEVLIGLCNLAHRNLARRDEYAYSLERILSVAQRHRPLALEVVADFLARFDPEGKAAQPQKLRERIEQVEPSSARTILAQLLDIGEATKKTNAYLEDRYGLSLRLDPALMEHADRDADPHGVFFVHGRGWSGFHVRFRDIARGGVRAVVPRGLEQYTVESIRLFDEVYDLAFAQELKNKDIPEGGSKAWCCFSRVARWSSRSRASRTACWIC